MPFMTVFGPLSVVEGTSVLMYGQGAVAKPDLVSSFEYVGPYGQMTGEVGVVAVMAKSTVTANLYECFYILLD